MKYRLRSETLFLTVNILDRYLTFAPVPRRSLQLVGVVSMLVAAKFEEISPPEVHDFVYITDNAYSKEEILLMECQLLTTLGFQMVVPTAAHFLDRLARINRCDEVHREVASYLIEISLLDIRTIRHAPSHLVAAALLLSNELLGRHPAWPGAMVQHTCRTEQQLRECVLELKMLLDTAPSSSLQAVHKKFLLAQ